MKDATPLVAGFALLAQFTVERANAVAALVLAVIGIGYTLTKWALLLRSQFGGVSTAARSAPEGGPQAVPRGAGGFPSPAGEGEGARGAS